MYLERCVNYKNVNLKIYSAHIYIMNLAQRDQFLEQIDQQLGSIDDNINLVKNKVMEGGNPHMSNLPILLDKYDTQNGGSTQDAFKRLLRDLKGQAILHGGNTVIHQRLTNEIKRIEAMGKK